MPGNVLSPLAQPIRRFAAALLQAQPIGQFAAFAAALVRIPSRIDFPLNASFLGGLAPSSAILWRPSKSTARTISIRVELC